MKVFNTRRYVCNVAKSNEAFRPMHRPITSHTVTHTIFRWFRFQGVSTYLAVELPSRSLPSGSPRLASSCNSQVSVTRVLSAIENLRFDRRAEFDFYSDRVYLNFFYPHRASHSTSLLQCWHLNCQVSSVAQNFQCARSNVLWYISQLSEEHGEVDRIEGQNFLFHLTM